MSDNEENNTLKEPTDKPNDKVEITVPLAIKKSRERCEGSKLK